MTKVTESYTGVRVVDTTKEVIDCLYENKSNNFIWEEKMYPNMFLVLKANGQSAMGIVGADGTTVNLISDKAKLGNIKPPNKEQ
jgi:hypothetical protein